MITKPEINKAVKILHEGGLVAFPTETVYGLGGDATNPTAIKRIFKAKERPYDHPLIVHIAQIDQLADWACDISPMAFQLAKRFWPGPLTMILKKQPQVLELVTGGQETVGIRIPKHSIAQELLHAFGGGIAAPSANRFTRISPTRAQAVQEELGEKVDLILDGGACEVGLESTIIDMSGDYPLILRPGLITAEMIARELGVPVATRSKDIPTTRAPGMHHLHYAPTTPTKLMTTREIEQLLLIAKTEDLPIAVVHHSPISQTKGFQFIQMSNEASAYAHELYHTLRTLDHQGLKRIIIETVPDSGDWAAIKDRLEKASGR